GTGRSAAARLPLRPGLDAVPRPDPLGDPDAGHARGHRAAQRRALGRLRTGPRPAVRRRRPGLSPGTGCLRVHPAPPGVGHPDRRAPAGRDRAAAGHRVVGLDRELGPGASDRRLQDECVMAAPELNFVELMRWFWRQLTSMRTALVLLLLLALAAIPGSVVPQTDVDAF